ncbi:MAG: hypothetical protein ACRDTD_03390 [Pseudonocardiaceae bacterium]
MPNENTGGSTNQGIQQYGGAMNVGVQAVGNRAGAQGSNVYLGHPPTEASIADLLVSVRELIQQHCDALPEASSAATTTDILGEELGQGEPSKSTVIRLLARLTKLVGPVKPVAEAVTELTKAMHAMFGN